MTIRLERAVADPRRDEAKGDELEWVIRQFRLAVSDLEKPLEEMPYLYDFFQLLEEARIGIWSPEVKTIRKATVTVVEKAWSEIRL